MFNSLYSVFPYHFLLTKSTVKSVFGGGWSEVISDVSFTHCFSWKEEYGTGMVNAWWYVSQPHPLSSLTLLARTDYALCSALSPVVSWVVKALPLQQEACDHPALPAGRIFVIQDSVFGSYFCCIPRSHSPTISKSWLSELQLSNYGILLGSVHQYLEH